MNYVGLYATFQRVGGSQSQGSEVQVVFLTFPKKCTGFPNQPCKCSEHTEYSRIFQQQLNCRLGAVTTS